jgi:hypothetical protein
MPPRILALVASAAALAWTPAHAQAPDYSASDIEAFFARALDGEPRTRQV